jgi:hypothetical protein
MKNDFRKARVRSLRENSGCGGVRGCSATAARLRRRSGSELGHAAVAARAANTSVRRQCAEQRARAHSGGEQNSKLAGADAGECGGAAALGEDAVRAKGGSGLRRKKEDERDPNERLKRLRSAFRAMTRRGGRMTGR